MYAPVGVEVEGAGRRDDDGRVDRSERVDGVVVQRMRVMGRPWRWIRRWKRIVIRVVWYGYGVD